MDKNNYITEGYRQLNNTNHYTPINNSLQHETSIKINQILTPLLNHKLITQKQFDFLAPPASPRPRYFYILPKIHKPRTSWPSPNMPPGRPIISDCASASKNISKFIQYHISNAATRHPSYVKDTYDFLHKLQQTDICEQDILVTMDVDNMYTNILTEDGMSAVKDSFPNYQDRTLKHSAIKLLHLDLTTNDFMFNNQHFLQTRGTAMGRAYAPAYANIFMAKWEKGAMDKSPLKPKLYLRYLDDIFVIWSHGIQAFWAFFHTLNNHHRTIKLKPQINHTTIDFLDVTVFKVPNNPKLQTKVYFKPTDTHQLLHKQSFHPKHTFSGIIKSQIIRYFKLSSNTEDFHESCNILFKALHHRHYSKRFLRHIKTQTLRLIRRAKDQEPMDIPGHSATGSSRCGGNKCETCPYIEQCNNFEGQRQDIHYPILSNLNCSTRNIIYLVTCTLCNLQYVGQTKNTLRERWARHKYDLIHMDLKNALAKHLDTMHPYPDRTNNLEFTVLPIEKIPDHLSQHHTKNIRLSREQYWIDELGTYPPIGLNIEHKTINKNNPMLPLVIKFSKTAHLASQIIKSHFINMQNTEYKPLKDHQMVIAYTRNKNLSDILVTSKT